jgi:hypothetical protein
VLISSTTARGTLPSRFLGPKAGRQQRPPGRRPHDQEGPPLPHRPPRRRSHRHHQHPRRTHTLRQHPAPRRTHRTMGHPHTGNPPTPSATGPTTTPTAAHAPPPSPSTAPADRAAEAGGGGAPGHGPASTGLQGPSTVLPGRVPHASDRPGVRENPERRRDRPREEGGSLVRATPEGRHRQQVIG